MVLDREATRLDKALMAGARAVRKLTPQTVRARPLPFTTGELLAVARASAFASDLDLVYNQLVVHRWLRLASRGIAITAVVAGTVLGLLYPQALVGAAGWSIAVAAVLFGLGSAVRRGLRIELGFGEQLVLGTVVWVFVCGGLLAIGCASRGPLFVVAGLGALLAVFDIVTRQPGPSSWQETPDDQRWVRIGLAIVLVTFLALNLLGMVASRGNPFDDHVAYTAFVQRMLDCGDLIEPYSFRRVSAYGGQTVLLVLAALRGDVQSTDLLDRGIYQWIAIAAALDLMRRRKLGLAVTAILVTFILLLWNYVSINSAAAWTGFTCFIAAYGFATRDELSPRISLVLVFAVCGAACTLRQNYLVPAGLFAGLLLLEHLRESARAASWCAAFRAEGRTIALACAAALALVIPYAIATYRSNETFLYPFALGTYNPVAALRPAGATFFDEIAYFFNVAVLAVPLQIWWLVAPVMLLARDARPRRPWRALLASSLLGLVILTHGFLQSDAGNMWRYAFGYMAPLAIIFYVETAANLPGNVRGGRQSLQLSSIATVLAWLAMMVQFFESRSVLVDRIQYARDNVKAALTVGSSKVDTDYIAAHHRMQAAVPPGAQLVVMLDDPYLLDYERNDIINLDLPGFSAPGAGLPSFTSPEHWRCYFTSQGIRHLAFVARDHSNYLYRRRVWLWRMYSDEELWRFMAAHIVDAMDTFQELAKTSPVLFHDDGMYLIDLGSACTESDRGSSELVRMDAFVRQLSEREFGNNSWQLASRRDVAFQADGYGPSEVGPKLEPTPTTDENGLVQLLFGKPLRDPPHRWLIDRTHVRVHGEGERRLCLRIWVNTARLLTKPRLSIWLDGTTLAHATPDAEGYVDFDVRTHCNGWCDLYIIVSTMHEFWRGAEDLNAVKLLEFDWTEATP